jgi:hypothetical protein
LGFRAVRAGTGSRAGHAAHATPAGAAKPVVSVGYASA